MVKKYSLAPRPCPSKGVLGLAWEVLVDLSNES